MAASVKMETDGGSSIKPDPEGIQQSQAMEEDDDFEDTGELEMPPPPSNVWLLRIPRVLHEQWNKVDQDQEIQVGVIRRGKQSGKVSMILDPNLPFHSRVERDYQINPISTKTKNTYIFSEKDLPGYKKGHRNNRNVVEENDALGPNRGGVDKRKRFQRRAIPKQTRLGHVITHESNCMPVPNETARMIQKLREKEEAENRREVTLNMEDGFAPEIQSFMNLSKNKKEMLGAHRGKAARPRPQENKASRMEQKDLLNALFRNFKRFQYWSMKALRDDLHQPEVYLKENLDNIADLVRSGRFNGLYTLKPEYREENFAVGAKEEAAPEESDLEALSGGDEEMDDASDAKEEPT